MERFLTMSAEEFREKLLLQPGRAPYSGPLDPDLLQPQSFSYLRAGDMLLRSQVQAGGWDGAGRDGIRIDCHDPSLPGESHTFDLKSRATVPIRQDCGNYHMHLGYRITRLLGQMHSYEREFYDMVRSCFIKYALQLRIGQMDGAFVTYHNTERVFGFEYVSLEEIERCVYGSGKLARRSFDVTVQILIRILDEFTNRWEGQMLRVVASAHPARPELDLFVFPSDPAQDSGWSQTLRDGDLPGLDEEGDGEVDPEKHGVARYKLRVHSTVNGRQVEGPLPFDEGDDLDVHYALDEVPVRASEFRDFMRRIRSL
eukprot:tig00020710_g13278.t1